MESEGSEELSRTNQQDWSLGSYDSLLKVILQVRVYLSPIAHDVTYTRNTVYPLVEARPKAAIQTERDEKIHRDCEAVRNNDVRLGVFAWYVLRPSRTLTTLPPPPRWVDIQPLF